jgi:transcriptional regulator
MLTQDEKERVALLQGTLDLLILRILLFGPEHGQGIARSIQTNSDEVLLVDHGASYPALQRMEAKGWIRAEWGVSSNNRRARFYTLTAKGRKQLNKETSRWRTISNAMARILDLKGLETRRAECFAVSDHKAISPMNCGHICKSRWIVIARKV